MHTFPNREKVYIFPTPIDLKIQNCKKRRANPPIINFISRKNINQEEGGGTQKFEFSNLIYTPEKRFMRNGKGK